MTNEVEGPTMRIALGIEYDGSNYRGWQTQPQGGAIQDHVESALTQLADAPIAVVAAGRTDAGVHALHQVVHFDAPVERDANAWVRGTNRFLPANIRVLWATQVASDFHARFSARSRSYQYWLLNDAVGPGVFQGRMGWFHSPLDEARMQAAADMLVGEHDFTTFRSSECQAKSPVRVMASISVVRAGQIIRLDFRANAFLHHMVRNLVGSLVYVGCGRQDVDWMGEILRARDRALAAPTFAPDGLYLSAVDYDAGWSLPSIRPRIPWSC
ncbi:MAG: tRNA pseudouridine(38-40) synthase TruA [Burkholderiales bacterium]|nr:tRNA pseudouridine(38-40) synthase TruA [Burkholderiales bacterium]